MYLRLAVGSLCLALLAFVVGCSGGTRQTAVIANLNGAQVVPGVATVATGSGGITIRGSRERVEYTVQTEGPFSSPVTLVQIHYGPDGVNGPALFTLFDAAVDGSFPGALSGSLTSMDFLAQPPGSPIADFSQAETALLNGNAYFLISTVDNPNGEIRGQTFAPDLVGNP